MQFHRRTLDNGLEVIAETNLRAHSAAVGFFVKTGSRDETPALSGVSHFLEHMAFKGNDRFSADDVNRVFDELGARYNASTSEEVTLFYAAVLPEYLPRTFELLSALLRPALREEDFELERQVILEEIGMYDDAPAFQVYDHAMQTHFNGHPLGRRILGTTESVSALTVDQMRAYHEDRYRAGNLVLAVAGAVKFDDVVRLAEQHCGWWPAGKCPRTMEEPRPKPASTVVLRPTHQQEHILQFAPAPSTQSPLRFAADLLAVVVGDDSGSRLYWEIADPGHAEVAEMTYTDFDGAGCWGTYLSCAPEEARDNLGRVADIYAEVNEAGVTADELEQARNKVCTRIVLASERPMGRLSALGGNWICREEYRTVEEDLATVQALGHDDIAELLERYPLGQTTTAGVGPLESIPQI